MKKNKPEMYSSAIIDEVFEGVTPEESEKIEKKMLLAAKIDDALKANGWKKKDLAKALNKNPSEITKWLSGTHNFTTETLWDLERILEIQLINLNDRPREQVITFHIEVRHEAPLEASYLDIASMGLKHQNIFQSKTRTRPSTKPKTTIGSA